MNKCFTCEDEEKLSNMKTVAICGRCFREWGESGDAPVHNSPTSKNLAVRREGTLNLAPDPGLWVRHNGFIVSASNCELKITKGDITYNRYFFFPSPVKILECFPDGVRVLTDNGDSYLIFGIFPFNLSIYSLTQHEIDRMDQWKLSYTYYGEEI